jgi:hypothetical protein
LFCRVRVGVIISSNTRLWQSNPAIYVLFDTSSLISYDISFGRWIDKSI